MTKPGGGQAALPYSVAVPVAPLAPPAAAGLRLYPSWRTLGVMLLAWFTVLGMMGATLYTDQLRRNGDTSPIPYIVNTLGGARRCWPSAPCSIWHWRAGHSHSRGRGACSLFTALPCSSAGR